jgi:1,4-dihydroxy-2-naphthoyl-CoA hydrolase
VQLTDQMGIEVVEATADRVVATMRVRDNLQPYGLLHGGASVVLAETVGATGAGLWAAGFGRQAVGIEINATHHRAVRTGTVTAVATPVHRGRSLATYEVAISDESGRRTCTCRVTCRLSAAAPGAAGV